MSFLENSYNSKLIEWEKNLRKRALLTRCLSSAHSWERVLIGWGSLHREPLIMEIRIVKVCPKTTYFESRYGPNPARIRNSRIAASYDLDDCPEDKRSVFNMTKEQLLEFETEILNHLDGIEHDLKCPNSVGFEYVLLLNQTTYYEYLKLILEIKKMKGREIGDLSWISRKPYHINLRAAFNTYMQN